MFDGECAMQSLRITAVPIEDRPGDLRATIHDDELQLPERIVSALLPLGVRNAVDLLSYFESFPSALEKVLGWDQAAIEHARKAFRRTLKGHVSDHILHPPPREQPSFGAMHPTDFPRRPKRG
jgi:hypothetical protein